MLNKKIPTATSPDEARRVAIRFGSADEKEWLDKFFKPGGGPPELPYYIPGTGEWVQERYPQRALQRRRKDFEGTIFYHPTDQTWALKEVECSPSHMQPDEASSTYPDPSRR